MKKWFGPGWPRWPLFLAGFLAIGLRPAHAGDETLVYTVQAGDTLSQIAQAQLGNPEAWKQLQRLNKVADPDRLVPGARIRIPLGLSRSQPGNAQVVWVQGALPSERYQVQVARDSAFTDVLQTNEQSVPEVRVASSQACYIRIKRLGLNGFPGAFESVQVFDPATH